MRTITLTLFIFYTQRVSERSFRPKKYFVARSPLLPVRLMTGIIFLNRLDDILLGNLRLDASFDFLQKPAKTFTSLTNRAVIDD